jgi:hypothetical protein
MWLVVGIIVVFLFGILAFAVHLSSLEAFLILFFALYITILINTLSENKYGDYPYWILIVSGAISLSVLLNGISCIIGIVGFIVSNSILATGIMIGGILFLGGLAAMAFEFRSKELV